LRITPATCWYLHLHFPLAIQAGNHYKLIKTDAGIN
jgi:hypothetical protein